MKRRWFLVLGIFLIVGQLTILAAFGIPISSKSSAIVTFLITGCAGVLYAIGGTGRQFRPIRWNQFIGAADFLLGLIFVLGTVFPIWNSTLPYENSNQLLFAVAAIGGVASLLFIGVDWVRGDQYFNLIAYESGPILSRK